VSRLRVTLRLRRLEDVFTTPDVDPFSHWYQAYSRGPAIDYVEACVADHPEKEHVEIVVELPRENSREGDEAQFSTALVRYCDARLAGVERESKRNNSRGWIMLAFTVFVVAFFVFLAHRLQDSSWEALTIAAEGLSIAAWVLLWHPLEALVFNRWDFRLDRRVLRTIRDRATVRVEALDLTLDD
jgi:hypothetical protein